MRGESIDHIRLSPDGRYLAASVPDPEDDRRRFLVVLQLADRKQMQATRFDDDRTVAGIEWVGAERLVVKFARFDVLQDDPELTPDLLAVDADGSAKKMIFGPLVEADSFSHIKKGKAEWASYQWLSDLPEDDDHILIAKTPYAATADAEVWPEVIKLNVRSGKQTPMGRGPAARSEMLADSQGRVRFGYTLSRNREAVLYSKSLETNAWQEISRLPPGSGGLYPLAVHADQRQVYFLANDDDPRLGLILWDSQTGERKSVYRHPVADISDELLSSDGTTVLAIDAMPGEIVRHYVAPNHPEAKLLRGLEQAFAGYQMDLVSVTRDASLGIVRVRADDHPGEYHLVDMKTRKASFLMEAKSALASFTVPRRKPVAFKARDGLELNGYLTLPATKAEGPLPTVLLVHGGPIGVRDVWGFAGDAQLLAHHGYAVLQVNYRGSAGYGRDFRQAGVGQWGTGMQDDLMDALNHFVASGVVDAKRVCIMGHSYGAYAALRGVTRDPKAFRCAVASMGVYDLPLIFKEGDASKDTRSRREMQVRLGSDMDELARRSPVHHAQAVEAALFLSHGGEDDRAPVEHVERLRKALDQAGKPYEYLEFPREGYSLSKPANREKFYSGVLAFLSKHLKP